MNSNNVANCKHINATVALHVAIELQASNKHDNDADHYHQNHHHQC